MSPVSSSRFLEATIMENCAHVITINFGGPIATVIVTPNSFLLIKLSHGLFTSILRFGLV